MHYLAICLFLPIVNALLIVKIRPNSFYGPYSVCSFIRNATMPSDASMESCIWECVYELNCQTAVYFYDNKICSMFVELYTAGKVEPSGNVQASVICYRKDHASASTTTTTATTAGANIICSCPENTVVCLVCPNSMRLTIVDAFYGVYACANMAVTPTVNALCTGLISCSFTADNAFFSDPCFGQVKTFQLTYFCS